MREIKFRFWNKYQKIMSNNPGGMNIGAGCSINALINESKEHYEIMQFTGLLDKNGKEIYEGDIIKIPDDWDEYGFNAGENYQVYFAFGGFRLKPKYKKNAKGSYLEDDKIEIIGNVYENPELLEAK